MNGKVAETTAGSGSGAGRPIVATLARETRRARVLRANERIEIPMPSSYTTLNDLAPIARYLRRVGLTLEVGSKKSGPALYISRRTVTHHVPENTI